MTGIFCKNNKAHRVVDKTDHLGGVGLNFTSEIIYLQPLDSSAAAGVPVIYSL